MVLLDIEMPNMNGIETFEHMNEMELDIPVIFLTASGDEDDVLNAIYVLQELLKRVAKGLEKK